MTREDILDELTSFDGVLLTNNNIHDILGKIKACIELLIQSGVVDKNKLQNCLLVERQKIVDKYGYPEYNVILPNLENK